MAATAALASPRALRAGSLVIGHVGRDDGKQLPQALLQLRLGQRTLVRRYSALALAALAAASALAAAAVPTATALAAAAHGAAAIERVQHRLDVRGGVVKGPRPPLGSGEERERRGHLVAGRRAAGGAAGGAGGAGGAVAQAENGGGGARWRKVAPPLACGDSSRGTWTQRRCGSETKK